MPADIALTPQRRGPLTVHVAEEFVALGVDCFVTDRFGGVSAPPYDSLNLAEHVGDDPASVRENRRRVAEAAGLEADRFITARQVHGNRIHLVDEPTDGVDADGLVTSDSSVALAILVADCVPVLIVDPTTARVAVVHAGWRGLALSVLSNALDLFARTDELHVLLGPAISVASYQVGPDVASRFADVPGALAPDTGDRQRLDLRRVAAHQLVAAGVRDQRVYVTREVTDGGTPFFSDRAQRPTGRFALVGRGPDSTTP